MSKNTRSITINKELHDQLSELSRLSGCSIARMANNFIRSGLDQVVKNGPITIDISGISKAKAAEPCEDLALTLDSSESVVDCVNEFHTEEGEHVFVIPGDAPIDISENLHEMHGYRQVVDDND